jgi:hypothetical protein
MHRSLMLSVVFALVLSLTATYDMSTAWALPPDTPSKSTAQSELNSLTVSPEGSLTGYSRDKLVREVAATPAKWYSNAMLIPIAETVQ